MNIWRVVTDPKGLVGKPLKDRVKAHNAREAFIAARMNRGGSREVAEAAWRNFERQGLIDAYLGEDGKIALAVLIDAETQDPMYFVKREED